MASITRPRSQQSQRRAGTERAVFAAVRRLLDAGECFTELGVRRIATEAGIARSTFYLCFQDKTEVLVRLTATMKDELFSRGAAWRPTGPGGGPEALAAVYAGRLAYCRERAPLLAAAAEVAAYDPVLREARAQEIERFAHHITSLLEEEQREGRLSVDVDPVTAGQVLAWGGEQVIARQVTAGTAEDDARVAHEMAYGQWFGTYRRRPGPDGTPA